MAFFLLLLVAGYLFISKRSGSIKSSAKTFSVEDTASISLIEIESPGETVVITRDQSGWMINNEFMANTRMVNGILNLLMRLRATGIVPVSIRGEMFRNLQYQGKRVSIAGKRKTILAFYVYYDSIYTHVTYMMLENDDQVFRVEVPGLKRNNLDILFLEKESDWRNNILVHYLPEEIRSVRMKNNVNPDQSFQLVMQQEGDYIIYSLPDSTIIPDFNQDAVDQYMKYFNSISFERYVHMEQESKNGFTYDSVPERIITILDVEYNTLNIETYPRFKTNSAGIREMDYNLLYAKTQDYGWALVKYIDLDPVMKDIDYFLVGEKN